MLLDETETFEAIGKVKWRRRSQYWVCGPSNWSELVVGSSKE